MYEFEKTAYTTQRILAVTTYEDTDFKKFINIHVKRSKVYIVVHTMTKNWIMLSKDFLSEYGSGQAI